MSRMTKTAATRSKGAPQSEANSGLQRYLSSVVVHDRRIVCSRTQVDTRTGRVDEGRGTRRQTYLDDEMSRPVVGLIAGEGARSTGTASNELTVATEGSSSRWRRRGDAGGRDLERETGRSTRWRSHGNAWVSRTRTRRSDEREGTRAGGLSSCREGCLHECGVVCTVEGDSEGDGLERMLLALNGVAALRRPTEYGERFVRSAAAAAGGGGEVGRGIHDGQTRRLGGGGRGRSPSPRSELDQGTPSREMHLRQEVGMRKTARGQRGPKGREGSRRERALGGSGHDA
jgi:hypothetical protein